MSEQRREELRNEAAHLRQQLNAAGVEIACAIAAGMVIADLPQETRDGVVALRGQLHQIECEMAEMDGQNAPALPLCMVPRPPASPPV